MSKRDMLVVVSVLAATVVAVGVLVAIGPSVALAEPAQQFSLQLRSARSGQLALSIKLRTFDTTGAVPPTPTETYIRLPAGAGVRKEFRTRQYECDGPALRLALDTRPSRTQFAERVANLKPFIRSLEGGRSRADRAALANARVCERSRIGGGSGLIDARRVTPVLSEPIPVRFSVFLSRPRAPGAVVGYAILGSADERAPIVRRYPVVGGVHAAIVDDIVEDATPDGLYGLKLMVPTGPIAGFDISIAEVDTAVRGLKIGRGTCLATSRRGRCTRRQPADVYSFVVPQCPPAGTLSALMFTGFPSPTPSLTTTFQLPCPSFVR
ncbi:MAG TPA: hypothetical protein VK506_04770 [Conexibacter sp.]|nr:hypothetical protein [Conexibacter sp.]